MYEFEKKIELITTKLGDSSSLVQADLKELLAEANTATSKIKSLNSESAERRVENKTLKDEHAKQIESFSDYESLSDQIGTLTKQLEDSNGELKTVYDSKKLTLKSLYEKTDFESDKLKPLSSRFKGLENIDDLSNEEVNTEIYNFEWLSGGKIEGSPKIILPKDEEIIKKKPVGKFGR